MTVQIRLANNDDAKEWDTIISKSSQGTIFHEWNWLKITEKHTQSTLYPLIGLKNGATIGVFPLFFQQKGPFRMVFSPPPRAALFYLGPVMTGYNTLTQEKWEHVYNSFLNSVENFITNDLRANYTSISLSPTLQDPRPFKWSGYAIEPQYDFVTDISIGPDALLQTLDKKQRQSLNHARKKGIIVEIGGIREYETILDLMDVRYSQQAKILTSSRDYFLDIFNAFEDNLQIVVAKVDGEIITGLIGINYRDTYYSWIGNPKPKILITPSPNDLMIWESIRYAYENGLHYYTTLGAAGDKRLHTYYAAKYDPELRVRYRALKKSFFTGIFEKSYSKILKPLRGKVKYLISYE